MDKRNSKTALMNAISICQSQSCLARKIGVGQPYIWNWLNRSNGRVPAEYCLAIEEATLGQVTRYDLRPDVFGEAPEKDAA